jgi:Na+/proline symporter
MSRKATVVLAAIALSLALIVAVVTPERSVFWFVIFGWSGIAATFCPTVILSLFWTRMTAQGAMAAMVAGFVGVPLFAFGAPHLPEVGHLFEALTELPPAFLLSCVVGIVVSLRTQAPDTAQADLDHARATP